MKAYYCIQNIYRGLFTKKFVGNSNIVPLPVDQEKTCFLDYYGIFRRGAVDKKVWVYYGWAKTIDIPSILQNTIDSNKHFKIIESIPCKVSNKSADIPKIIMSKKGKYIRSNLELAYDDNLSNYLGLYCYFINGDIKFIEGTFEGQGKAVAGKTSLSILSSIFSSVKGIRHDKF